MEEVLAILADPSFYTSDTSPTDIISEHATLKKRIAELEEEWFLLNEEIEEEMKKQGSEA